MINLDEFINEYNGKQVDWDKKYGNQCVDIIRCYLDEVLKKPQFVPVSGAKNVWDDYNRDDFIEFHNTPNGLPQKGDIIIWGFGKYGHIGIFVSGDLDKFTAFEQNYPIGSNCHLQKHNYKGVIGWLRPKNNTLIELKKKIIDFINKL